MSNRISEQEFIGSIVEFANKTDFTYSEIKEYAESIGVTAPRSISKGSSVYTTGRGLRDFASASSENPKVSKPIKKKVTKEVAAPVATTPEPVFENVVSIKSQPENRNQTEVFEERIDAPEVDPLYIAWGNHSKILKIIKSGKHYPTFITGLSGNGKTMTVEQACAKAKRKLVVVNITEETDEDDLIGGFRLQDGDTVFKYGPVIQAMKEGAVLLLDEIDLASHKIMALQSIIDGKGYFIKKTGEFVKPEKGFTVFATANTKGRGDENGLFAGTQILNEAFLERFAKYIPQGYPSKSVESKILTQLMKHETGDKVLSDKDTTFIQNLVDWSDVIRAAFNDGGVDNLITTRRLALAIKGYVIFDGDVKESIDGAVERFDEDTATAFRELFETVSVDGFETTVDEETGEVSASGL